MNMMNLTTAQKRQLTSFVGVFYDKEKDKWIARCYFKKRDFLLGAYQSERKAAICRELAIITLNSTSIRNFPDLTKKDIQTKLSYESWAKIAERILSIQKSKKRSQN
ncbi:MAG: hypothetical protein HQK59_06010 [Deltaproteobacteria bacterium]|nr:hypothetical protein [Deltaproteobacteria bacterium]